MPEAEPPMQKKTKDPMAVDVPDGMDAGDALIAIRLLYTADQTYRSVLRDFARFERGESPGPAPGTASPTDHTKRKRLRNRASQSTGSETHRDAQSNHERERPGRITHLHVTSISSVFLPSWDLSAADVTGLSCLRTLRLDGCDSVPSEVFFGLPCLEHLRLAHCGELRDPVSAEESHREELKRGSRSRASPIERLEVRGGGLGGEGFASALGVLLPWVSETLVCLRLAKVAPYGGSGRRSVAASVRSPDQRCPGALLRSALASLARGPGPDSLSRGPALEEVSLAVPPLDPVEFLRGVVPLFPRLEAVHLPGHGLADLSGFPSRLGPPGGSVLASRLRRLVLGPSSARRTKTRGSGEPAGTPGGTPPATDDREVLLALLRGFPELTRVGGAPSPGGAWIPCTKRRCPGFPGSRRPLPCPVCKGDLLLPGSVGPRGFEAQGPALPRRKGAPTLDDKVEALLLANHSGRCLTKGLSEPHGRVGGRSPFRRPPLPLSVWPLVLERAWKKPPPGGRGPCGCPWSGVAGRSTAAVAGAIFGLLRDGPVVESLAGSPRHPHQQHPHQQHPHQQHPHQQHPHQQHPHQHHHQ